MPWITKECLNIRADGLGRFKVRTVDPSDNAKQMLCQAELHPGRH